MGNPITPKVRNIRMTTAILTSPTIITMGMMSMFITMMMNTITNILLGFVVFTEIIVDSDTTTQSMSTDSGTIPSQFLLVTIRFMTHFGILFGDLVYQSTSTLVGVEAGTGGIVGIDGTAGIDGAEVGTLGPGAEIAGIHGILGVGAETVGTLGIRGTTGGLLTVQVIT